MRGPAAPPSITIKKTRTAANPVKKESQPPKAPRTARKGAATPGRQPPSTPLQGAGRETRSNGSEDDLDKITAGMKKIKINLITKSQREARERAEAEAGSKSGSPKEEESLVLPEGHTVTTPPILSPAEQSTYEGLITPAATTGFAPPKPDVSTPVTGGYPAYGASSPVVGQTPLPESSPVFPPPPPPPANSSTPDVFIPYQPEGHEPMAMSHQGPLRWLPPNTGTPTPMKRAELPVFTATSAIPFAVPATPGRRAEAGGFVAPGGAKKEEGREASVWEIPETPQK